MSKALVLILSCLVQVAAQGIVPTEYAARRAKLMAAHPDGLIIVHAREDHPRYSEGGFRQSANFFYLTGSDALGAILVIDAPKKKSWMFGGETPGVEHTAPKTEMSAFLARRFKEGARSVYDTLGGPS